MRIEDIVDTIKCREQILKYMQYLEDGNEDIPEDFAKHIIENILTLASIQAMSRATPRLAEELVVANRRGKKSMDECAAEFEKQKNLYLKHCIKLEIEHNHTREESQKLNPQFTKEKIKIL